MQGDRQSYHVKKTLTPLFLSKILEKKQTLNLYCCNSPSSKKKKKKKTTKEKKRKRRDKDDNNESWI